MKHLKEILQEKKKREIQRATSLEDSSILKYWYSLLKRIYDFKKSLSIELQEPGKKHTPTMKKNKNVKYNSIFNL